MKKLLAFVMVLAMICSMPVLAFAEDLKDEPIWMVPISRDSNYWQALIKGFEDAAAEKGCVANVMAPVGNADANEQISLIQQAVNNGAKALVLGVSDANALVNACMEARTAGTEVVLVDSHIATDDYYAAYCTDNYLSGVKAAEAMGEYLNGKGKVFILSVNTRAESVILREKGFEETIAQKYPEIEIVNSLFINNDAYSAATTTADIVTANPDLNAIFTSVGNLGTGVATTLKEVDRTDIKIFTNDGNKDIISYMEEGIVLCAVVQAPYQMGYNGFMAAYNYLNGELIAEENRDVWLEAVVVTPENMSQDDITALYYWDN